MRNLKLYLEVGVDVEVQSEDESLLFSAFDVEQDRMFFASSSGVLHILHLNPFPNEQGHKSFKAEQGGFIDIEAEDHITALDYLMEKESLIAGTSDGFLLLYNLDECTTKPVGRVEGGIKDISPSPDGALIAIAFGIEQTLVMTQDWEFVYETTSDTLEHDHKLVSGDLGDSSNCALETRISWRGDGKYFATLSSLHTSFTSQKLRIWERESRSFQASSDSRRFMGVCLDWMPTGAKIVASCDRKVENKCPSITFFERNGLERGSFSINESIDATVKILKWNCYADLLAALVVCDSYDAIKIWSFTNNRWYLKQELRFLKKDEVNFEWDPKKPLQLICWTLDGKIKSYNFVWITAITENSTALVIDNARILVTPLSLSLMPPPMSLFTLQFPSPVQNIAFYSRTSNPRLAASLSDGSLCVVEFPAIDNWEILEEKDLSVQPSRSDVTFGTIMHLVWLDSHILLGVSDNGSGHGSSLLEIELACSENSSPDLVSSSGWYAKILQSLVLEQLVIGIVPNPTKKGSAFIQFDSGSIFEYSPAPTRAGSSKGATFQKIDHDFGFSSPCPWMNAVTVTENALFRPLIFGLDDNGRLQLNKRVICHNCTSFSFYSNSVGDMQQAVSHLILTTKQDYLCVVNINETLGGKTHERFENLTSADTKKIQEGGDPITIWERGAKIVGIVHGDEAAIIMQTNRGNLECIYPRKLVIASIVNALIQRRFRDAMTMVRRHRIDFNVIVDHCGWHSFIKLAPEFVCQVNNLSHITDFVCSIKNENVMETIYKNVVSLSSLEKPSGISDGIPAHGKVSTVLLAIKQAIEEKVKESPARELCILTTLARCEPPALEEALKRIKVVREKELTGTNDDAWRKLYPSAEDAVKHLLWLSDSEAVYETALGLYDINLAAMVALNSHKDPKEFLPFLQGLERMQPLIMKYTIDLRLQRYDSALKNMFSAGETYYEDCINLMKNNPQLFPLGLLLFADRPQKVQVLESWGDHLFGEKCFEDAATNYLCCSSLQKAFKAYRACGNWKKLFLVAGLLKLEKEEILQLANELSEEFNALGKPSEAAKIAIEYGGDVASGVAYFISAREWEEALRIGYMYRREDLVSEATNAAIECASTLISEYQESMEKVGKYLTRYLAVRQRRLLLKAKLESEESSMNEFDDDTSSETSSNFSGMSAYTAGTTKGSRLSVGSSMTSKSRQQRQQRKKGGKIRAGSPGEEMALVDHLKGMSLTDGAQHELKTLLSALVMIGKEETARKLQRIASSFQISQLAAAVLAEDTLATEVIDEKTHTLEHYMQKIKRESPDLCVFSWQSKVLLPP